MSRDCCMGSSTTHHGKSSSDDHHCAAIIFWEEEEEEEEDDHDDDNLLLKNKGLYDSVDEEEENRQQSQYYNYDPAERRIYWESLDFLLQEILDEYKRSGSKYREEIKRMIDIAKDSNLCKCWDRKLRGLCLKCLRRAVVHQLCIKGFSAALCTSNWNTTPKIPAGIHEYIEVMASTQGRREEDWFLVELGFSDEFRMAKACDEYNRLIGQLPEIYIGKVEHLKAIIRIICEAAKRSSDEQKIHMGPWRTRSFMQMKWSASSKRRFLDQSSNELSSSNSSRPEVARTVKVA